MEKEELQEKIVHPEIVAEVEKKMLSESEFEDLALLFKMFADSTRLKVLKALFEREMCVGDLAVLLKMTHSAVSHQLASLKKPGWCAAVKTAKWCTTRWMTIILKKYSRKLWITSANNEVGSD